MSPRSPSPRPRRSSGTSTRRGDAVLEAIRVLVLDVDGVLTDGGLWVDPFGRELKRFDIKDGYGLRRWLQSGHEVIVASGRGGPATRHRLGELGVRWVLSAVPDKVEAVGRVLEQLGHEWSVVAMIGDDLPDLDLLRMVALPVAVADAVSEVREAAAWVTERPGGHGAVREVIEAILRRQGRWSDRHDASG
ncbi:MAG: hypothetical protein FJ257_05935 [Phycisphaerae bacterium]|nr:hypothetical protein [Phycisphaerae bacterium]